MPDDKQEVLIWLSLVTLLNMAEGAEVPAKMLSRGMLPVLARLLSWRSPRMQLPAAMLLLRISLLAEVRLSHRTVPQICQILQQT